MYGAIGIMQAGQKNDGQNETLDFKATYDNVSSSDEEQTIYKGPRDKAKY